MLKKIFFLSLLNFVFIYSVTSRDQINVVGSSTVYPFSTVVAENFGNKTGVLSL